MCRTLEEFWLKPRLINAHMLERWGPVHTVVSVGELLSMKIVLDLVLSFEY